MSSQLPKAHWLRAEVEEGNCEYKYRLTRLTDSQFQHRLTQLLWRLNEGGGVALYEVGFLDDGYPLGLSESDIEESLATLRCLAVAANCTMTVKHVQQGDYGSTAEVLLARDAVDIVPPPTVFATLLGPQCAGKSSLLGLLGAGGKDNGRGLARSHVLRHPHEVLSGCSSSVSVTSLYFRDGKPQRIEHKNDKDAKNLLHCKEGRAVHVLDVPGDVSRLSTVAYALCSAAPHLSACFLLVQANADASCVSAAREHMRLALSLSHVSLAIVITKFDVLLTSTQQEWFDSLSGDDVILQYVTNLFPDVAHNRLCVCRSVGEVDGLNRCSIPVFLLSCVNGTGVDVIAKYLSTREPVVAGSMSEGEVCFRIFKVYSNGKLHKNRKLRRNSNSYDTSENEEEDASLEGSIGQTPNHSSSPRHVSPYLLPQPIRKSSMEDEASAVLLDSTSSGRNNSCDASTAAHHVLVDGLVMSGQLKCGQHVLVGPDVDGDFYNGTVLELRLHGVSIVCVAAGQICSADVAIVTEQCEGTRAIHWKHHQGKHIIGCMQSIRSMKSLRLGVRRCRIRIFRHDRLVLQEKRTYMFYSGIIRQMVKIIGIEAPSGVDDELLCVCEFIHYPEYLMEEEEVLLREHNIDGIIATGTIVDICV